MSSCDAELLDLAVAAEAREETPPPPTATLTTTMLLETTPEPTEMSRVPTPVSLSAKQEAQALAREELALMQGA